MKTLAAALMVTALALAACGKKTGSNEAANVVANTTTVTTTTAVAAPANATAPAPAAVAGFDPATAPMGRAPTERWPYFGMIDGYSRATIETVPSSDTRKWMKDVPFEQYYFFDGVKFIPVEGRFFSTLGIGKGSAFFGVRKTYEKLIHDLGGVTVFEGTGKEIADKKLEWPDPRFRARYRPQDDQMGVYMVKTPTSEIWIEVYHPWEDTSENYWLTILEKKGLEVKVQAIPADEMKKTLDATGHVALYVNFDTDKTSIRPESAPIIGEIVKLLNNNPGLNLTVEGHTDNVGGAAHNQTLSEGRANSVVGALMAQGVPMSRLTPKGFGASKPVADNGAEDGRAKNRRVELVKR